MYTYIISEYVQLLLITVATIITMYISNWDVTGAITDAMIMYWFIDILFEQVYDKYLWNDLVRNVTKLQHLKCFKLSFLNVLHT